MNRFILKPLGNSAKFVHRWKEFVSYILAQAKVAVIKLDEWELFIPPPTCIPSATTCINVYYRPKQAARAAWNHSSANVPRSVGYPSQSQGEHLSLSKCYFFCD